MSLKIFPILRETCLWHSPDHRNVGGMMHHTRCLNVPPLQIMFFLVLTLAHFLVVKDALNFALPLEQRNFTLIF